MQDTDIIKIELELTVAQARYLRRKCHKESRQNNAALRFSDWSQPKLLGYLQNKIMWEALADLIKDKIGDK
jgi:hypothetical protein